MSNVDKFVYYTIAKQLSIAKAIVDKIKQPAVLFDRAFIFDHVIMVDTIRVEVDPNGRQAILSASAQNTFTFPDYCRLLPAGYRYEKVDDIVKLIS